jgi:glycosyltransferase involved in cell wall biosynthesis
LDLFHLCRKLKLPIYPLRELVENHDFNYEEWMRHVRTWYRTQKHEMMWEQVQRIYFAMLYSEGWLFVRFLYNHEGGKYREPMMKFTKAVLRGYKPYAVKGRRATGAQVFKFLFKLKTDADWARLQREFDGYLEKMLKKYPPTQKLDAD